MQKKGGDPEKFKSYLKNALDQFEKAKEWADLSSQLQKVKNLINNNSNMDIPLKKDLAKRLAQCLNPELAVIHQDTLEIYALIFQRQIELNGGNSDKSVAYRFEWGSDLGLFLSGLYNFYQFAAFEVKKQFLDIVKDFILNIDKELLLSLPGFMICMLPALEDQNADLLKMVDEILKKAETIVGTSEFYGEIWKTMLRTNRTRLSAIKYLEKRIPKDLESAKELKRSGMIYISKFKIKAIPQKITDTIDKKLVTFTETKVVMERDNAREEQEKLHLELNNLDDYFYFFYPMKEKLCLNALLACLADTSLQSGVYVNRGALDFLISHAPIKGKINKEIENIQLVEGALNTLSRKDYAFLKKLFMWLFRHLDEDEDARPDLSDPSIKVLIPALKCLYKKYLDKNEIMRIVSKEKTNQLQGAYNLPILVTQTLLSDNPMISEAVLLHFSVDFIKYVKYYFNEKGETQKIRFQDNVKNLFDMVRSDLKSMWDALGKLLSDEINRNQVENSYQVEAIELIDFCLKDLKYCFKSENQVFQDLSEYLTPILACLLQGITKLSNSMRNLENVLPALDLIDTILQELDNRNGPANQMIRSQDEELVLDLQTSVNKFNDFYVALCEIFTFKGESGGMGNVSVIENSSEAIKLKLDTFKKASEILNKIQKYSDIQGLTEMPLWLQSVIECSKIMSAKIALVSTETFLNILDAKESQQNSNDPMRKLRSLILQSNQGEFQSMQSHQLSSRDSIYKTLQQTKNNHCFEIIQTLWQLLDEEEDHKQIVKLLMKFDGLLPALFSEVVINDLLDKAPRETKERGIKKFSIFWNLTSQFYPQYRPFYEKDTTDRRYGALHNVLHFLEQNDPTLRLSCKSWLSESKNFYNRILDPLIEEFLQNSKVFVSFTKQIFFYDQYDTKIVSENFSKLRNIILNTQGEMITYMIQHYASGYIQREFNEMLEWMLEMKQGQSRSYNHNYLEVIVYITLQFIMGQAVQSVDHALYQESQTVNASACEFMELILKSIESNQHNSNLIAHIIINPILRAFKQNIDNQNYAMQVHILNLLKVILFHCNFHTEDKKQQYEKVYREPLLIDCLIKGMKNEVSFVRNHFIEFTKTMMEPFKKHLKAQDFSKHISKLIDCFCFLMQTVDVTHFSANILGTNRLNNANARGGFQTTGKLVINQESDIAQLMNGFNKVLNDPLGITINENSKEVQQRNNGSGFGIFDTSEIEFKQAENSTFIGKIGKAVFGGGNDVPAVFMNNDENLIRETIHSDFKKIIVALLHCWNDLPIFVTRDFNFQRSGIYPYTSDDEKTVNAMIEKSLEKYKEQFSQGYQNSNDTRGTLSRDTKISTTVPLSQQIVYKYSDYIGQKTNPIQRQIIEFLRPYAKFSKHYLIEGIVLVWMDKKNLDNTSNVHKSLEKLMQILQSVKLTHFQVVECMNQLIEKHKWKTLPPKNKKKIVLARTDAQRESLLCQFLYTYLAFNIQQMFAHSIVPPTNQTNEDYEPFPLTRLYRSVLKFISCFQETRHPPSLCWLLEILNILSIKFSPTDAYRNDSKLKKDYYETLNEILGSVANVVSDSFKIQYSPDYNFLISFPPHVYELLRRFSPKFSEFNALNARKAENLVKQANQNKKMVQSQSSMGGPQNSMKKSGGIMMQQQQPKLQQLGAHSPPAGYDDVEDDEESKMGGAFDAVDNMGISHSSGLKIGHEMHMYYQKNNYIQNEQENEYKNAEFFYDDESQNEKQNLSEFMKALATYINYVQQSIKDTDLILYHRFFTILTLKGTLFNMTHLLVGGHQSHNAFDKIAASLKMIMDEVLKILNNTKKEGILDQNKNFIREAVVDFFASLMDTASQYLVKRYKAEIQEFFSNENFFIMSRRSLRKWSKIINHFISDQKDAVFDGLFSLYNKEMGILGSQDVWEKNKENALKRVAFLLFSGNDDQYDDKLDYLLKKMSDGFKAPKKIPRLQTQLFLLTRVLLLRFQTNTLTDPLRKLWPHLLNELESIFRTSPSNGNTTKLVIEAIKVVELMSAMNLEDFQMNQWIFMIDGYGMRESESLIDQPQLMQMTQTVPKRMGDAGDFQILEKSDSNAPNGIFQPFISRFMQTKVCTFYDQTGKDDQIQEMAIEDYFNNNDFNFKQIELRKSVAPYGSQLDKQPLETFTIKLQKQLTELNTKRTEIDKANFEATIEKDFIDSELLQALK